jgi:glycosyltransferase involved in cell wall biosynthesis
MPQLTLTIAGCHLSSDAVKAYFPSDVRGRIVVVPHVSRAEMPEMYASHDLFVLPSLAEGMPLVLLEAMATAMPVITTNTCGMADIVEPEYNGILVPAADASALSSSIERLCADVELRKYIGSNAQESVRRYTWPKVTARLEHILKLAVKTRLRNAAP